MNARYSEATIPSSLTAGWALWDLIGKAANQPVHRLLGQCRDRIRVYLTLVWPSHQAPTPAQQVEDIVR